MRSVACMAHAHEGPRRTDVITVLSVQPSSALKRKITQKEGHETLRCIVGKSPVQLQLKVASQAQALSY